MYLYIDLMEFLIDFILHIDKHLIEIVQVIILGLMLYCL